MDFRPCDADLQIDHHPDVSKESADYKEVYFAPIAHLLQEQKTRARDLSGFISPGVGKSHLCIGVCNYYARKGLSCAFSSMCPGSSPQLKLLFSRQRKAEEMLARHHAMPTSRYSMIPVGRA